jgi:tetratricopeptide (TPR) repeat protein
MTHCSDAEGMKCHVSMLLIGACLALGACASSPPAKRPAAPMQSQVPSTSTNAQQQFGAALALMKSGDRLAARDAFLALHRTHPAWSGPLTNLGILYAQLGQRGEAISAFARAVAANPDNAVAHNWLGSLYREGGDFQRAEAAYRQALQVRPDYAAAHRNLGLLYEVALRRPQDALPHYREAQRLAGGDQPMLTAWIRDLESSVGINVAGASR